MTLASISLCGRHRRFPLLLIFTTNHTFRLLIPWLLAFATLIFAFSKPIGRWAGHKHGDRSLEMAAVCRGDSILRRGLWPRLFRRTGIGVLMLAGLSFAGLESIHQMNALKVLLATVINGIAVVIFLCASFFATSPADRIQWPLALGMACASIGGGFFGMHFARKVKQNQLRVFILLIGISLTLIYFYRAYATV